MMISSKDIQDSKEEPSYQESLDKEFCVECYTELHYYVTLSNVRTIPS